MSRSTNYKDNKCEIYGFGIKSREHKLTRPFLLKFLVKKSDAGAVIGQKSAKISSIQSDENILMLRPARDQLFTQSSKIPFILNGETSSVSRGVIKSMQSVAERHPYQTNFNFAVAIPDGLGKRFCDAYMRTDPNWDNSEGALHRWCKFKDSSVELFLSSWERPTENNRFMVERILHFGGTIENLSRFVPMLCVKLAEESAYVLGYSLFEMSYNNSHFDNDINLAASYRRSNPPPSSHQSYSPLPGASSPFNHLSQVEHQSPGSIHPDSGERDSPHFSRLPLDPIPSSPYYPRTSSDWNSQTVGNGTWHSADCNDVPARRFESSSRGRKVDRRNSSCSRNRSSSTVPYGYNNRKLQSITSSATSSHRRYRLDRHGRSNGRTSTCDRRKDVRTFRGRPKSHWRQKRIPRRSRSDSSISSSSLYDFSADSESKKRLLGSIDHRRLQPIDVIRKSKKLTLESRSSNSRTSSNVDLKSISCRRKRFRKRESNNNQLDTEFSTQSLESVLPEIIEPTKVAAGTVIQSVASGCQPTTTDSSIGHSVTKNHSISLTSDINHSSNSKDEMQITLRIPDESIMAQLSWRLISNSDSNDVNIKEDLRSIRKEGICFNGSFQAVARCMNRAFQIYEELTKRPLNGP